MLKLDVRLSRKVGEANYGSRGASVHVELELDSGLVGEPARLQERIRQLFGVVRGAVLEELNGKGQAPNASMDNRPPTPSPATNGTSRNGGQRPATHSQVKAIHAIANRRHIDLSPFLNERFHVSRPDELSIKQASSVIDELKGQADDGRSA
jgi:hypothetical protein